MGIANYFGHLYHNLAMLTLLPYFVSLRGANSSSGRTDFPSTQLLHDLTIRGVNLALIHGQALITLIILLEASTSIACISLLSSFTSLGSHITRGAVAV